MSDSNGAELGQVLELLSDILISQQGMQEGIRALDRRMDQLERRMDQIGRRMEQIEHRMDQLDHRMDQLERRVGAVEHRIDELASQLATYHGSVVGHGILITELDEHVRRVEQHLNLPPAT